MTDVTDADVKAWLGEMSSAGYLNVDAPSRALASRALAMLDSSARPGPKPPLPSLPPADAVTPATLLAYMIDPTLAWLERHCSIPHNDEARVELLAIIGQETDWMARLQYGGPARSWYQFEKGGGVAGVLSHPASASKIQVVCDALLISCDVDTVYEAMAWNGFLATSMARLLLYADPAALPAVGEVQEAWDYYERNWRPGAPHPEVWPDRYATAQALL